MSVIAGPCNNFKDYIAFIEGRHTHMKLLEVNWKQRGFQSLPEPSPTGAVIRKLYMTLVSLLLFLTLTKAFPVTCLVDDWFVHKANFLTRLCYLYIVMQASKPKYYFAWTLADAVNNAAGFGFSGVDKNGNFCWDLLSNLNIWKIETATSFKMYLENWNIQTATWLKRVCYERVPWYPTVLTFVLSALWHGVYPGYYFTFLTGTLVTVAARTMRNNYRHYFLSSKALKVAYDVVTWAVTQLAVSYTVAPFVMLAVEPTISLYKTFEWCGGMCRMCQRPCSLGCWVFASLAPFPATGAHTSAPEGRRWLLTELIFQNIPRYGCSLGSPRPFDHSDDTQKTTEEKEPAQKNQEDLP
ncbi:lysophospholipid acyltransferase 1 isoform X4 [Puma concolor]|nr:lysophospholipid acyltransferase 1 isoform X4 [Puma concolor]